ncbi:MAG: hypothetical protein O3B22_16080 [Proteobacteria bacterium]|nr:hypothetical protein [Pseudomonadota bacterium]MDA1071222.1 hypothetical protein [Pseudomonadota bacterium]
MKTITPQKFNDGLALLSHGNVVLFHNGNLSLENWLNEIGFDVDEECAPFGYFFDYSQLVDFDPEEIFTYLDERYPQTSRATRFQQHSNLTTLEFVEYIKYRINSLIEGGDYPVVVIGTITDGVRQVFVGYEIKGHSWEGIRRDCLGLFDNLDEMLSTRFSDGVFEPLYNSIDEFYRGT